MRASAIVKVFRQNESDNMKGGCNLLLDEIIEKRRKQLEREMAAVPFEEMKAAAEKAAEIPSERSFKKALTSSPSPAIVAEIKKASPSQGVICEDIVPADVAVEYQKAGVAAISYCIEESFFMGSAENFKAIRAAVDIPLMCKDYIIDPYQIYTAKALGADAILLIAAILTPNEIHDYRVLAESLGMDVVSESNNADEVKAVISTGSTIFGINNRNRRNFIVALERTSALSEIVPEGGIILSESGIKTAEDVKFLADCDADAVLIGEMLLKQKDASKAIAELRSLI